MINNMISAELTGLYGERVLEDLAELIRLYDFYDGRGQYWQTATDLDYVPSRMVTNLTKKLIKRQARFMFGRTPEISLRGAQEDAENLALLEQTLADILEQSAFPERLLKAARDCFIGKRVAIKISGGVGQETAVQFRPSLEFVYETEDDDCDRLRKIIFFYQTNNASAPDKQRLWRQKYEMSGGRCFVTEGVYNGFGQLVEGGETRNTGLSFIPCRVIINDGLLGDMLGESDVAELMDSQRAYNRLKSDDLDALRFNMFPQYVALDADASSLDAMRIAPGALVDLMTDPSCGDSGAQAKLDILESSFGYDARFEHTLNRIKEDMHELLGVPNLSLEQLQGLAQSGRSMRALYWELLERSEEKWTVWEPALRWMCRAILEMEKIRGGTLPDCDYDVHIEHLYPIIEDEEAERELDMQEVEAGVRSRTSYMKKWTVQGENSESAAQAELLQIKREQTLMLDSFAPAVSDELSAQPYEDGEAGAE